MIGIIFCIVSMLMTLLVVILSRYRQDIASDISRGKSCCKCRSDIPESKEYPWYSGSITFCKSCERDGKLDSVFGKKNLSFYRIFDKNSFLYYKNLLKLSISFSALSVLVNVLSIYYKPLSNFGGIFLFVGSSISLIIYILTTKKKVQSN